MPSFKLFSEFIPKGDQTHAIDTLTQRILSGKKHHVLLGVTGSGKTFTMANVIEKVGKPTLVIAPNKTLAAQLYSEFRMLFPENAVEYFVSYYDYYQPEAYIPSSDTYIQKDSSINEMIDKLRHSATRSVLSRRDAIVVASVSCIFGLGAPEEYLSMRIDMEKDMEITRDRLLADLVAIHYERNDFDFYRGVFRVRGDRVEIFPSYEESKALRIDFFGDEIEAISEIDPLRGILKKHLDRVTIYPASHFVTQKSILQNAAKTITAELKQRIDYFRANNKLIEAQRIEERTDFDLEMMQELGYCNGIENYSRHLTQRAPGEPPPTLLDYFPKEFLVVIDESHISIPQLRAMYKGDRSRKKTLVEFGFRLPSALDNRPLKFEEFNSKNSQVVYVSATPSDYEIAKAKNELVEQIVRPTGLIDPRIDVRSAENQVDNLFEEIQNCRKRNERVLVTTLTKRMAEDLTEYYSDLGIKVRYLPEVSLVAILDADKEGFLRSTRSLVQICGRASRNVKGQVIMYADSVTPSMKQAIDETNRRRNIQELYNKKHSIIPESIEKSITSVFESMYETNDKPSDSVSEAVAQYDSLDDLDDIIKNLKKEMKAAADELEFERAAELRDQIEAIKKMIVFEL